MPLSPLSIDTIGELHDGAARIAINRELAKMFSDLEDRGPEDRKPRTVVITVEAVYAAEGEFFVTAQAKANLPPFRTGETRAQIRQVNGQPALAFQTMNAENPNQPTLFESLAAGNVQVSVTRATPPTTPTPPAEPEAVQGPPPGRRRNRP